MLNQQMVHHRQLAIQLDHLYQDQLHCMAEHQVVMASNHSHHQASSEHPCS